MYYTKSKVFLLSFESQKKITKERIKPNYIYFKDK